MNTFVGMGRLVRDPEIKQTPSNVMVCNFTIAINRRFKNSNGEYEADFLPCIAWRQTGEFISKYFRKGNMIGVVGTVQTRNWEDNDGKKHYATEIIVEQSHFCGAKSDSGGGSSGQANQADNNGGFFPGPPDQNDESMKLPFDL